MPIKLSSRLKFLAINIGIALLFFFLGTLAVSYQIIPDVSLPVPFQGRENLMPTPGVDGIFAEEDPIQLTNSKDIEVKRQALITYIWGKDGWPTSRDLTISTNIQDSQYASLFSKEGNLAQIDQYKVSMAYGLESYIYHFQPVKRNGKLFIYHAGHYVGFKEEDKTNNNGNVDPGLVIPGLIKQGYAVLAFSMPLCDVYHPVTYLEGIGKVEKFSHYGLVALLERPYRFFFEPIAVTINYVESHYHYDAYYMVGLSGGGWTTTVYAALDPRISRSFPVAGSIPLPYRISNGNDLGDDEQTDREFYDISSYSELYVLGSYGKGRSQTQILNYYDSCCFAGWNNPPWVEKVQSTLKTLGSGEFNYFRDETHKDHKISAYALSLILQQASK